MSHCVYPHSEETANMTFSCTCTQTCTPHTHHEQDAEVGQISEEILHADGVGVKGEIAADVLVELLHVLVHGGQLFILLPSMLAEAVREDQESRKQRRVTCFTYKACSNAMIRHKTSHQISMLICGGEKPW